MCGFELTLCVIDVAIALRLVKRQNRPSLPSFHNKENQPSYVEKRQNLEVQIRANFTLFTINLDLCSCAFLYSTRF